MLDTDFKNEVKQIVCNDLTKRFNRTKEYKELKSEFDIVSDTEIKSDLTKLIGEIVQNEIKKFFLQK